MIWTTRIISLLALAAFLPLSEAEELDVWTPRISYPHRDTVWHPGEQHHVKWDTSGRPSEITNPTGSLYLVQNDVINFNEPLASGFNLADGQVEITVPSVSGTFQLDLFGDSGNWSPPFTIQ